MRLNPIWLIKLWYFIGIYVTIEFKYKWDLYKQNLYNSYNYLGKSNCSVALYLWKLEHLDLRNLVVLFLVKHDESTWLSSMFCFPFCLATLFSLILFNDHVAEEMPKKHPHYLMEQKWNGYFNARWPGLVVIAMRIQEGNLLPYYIIFFRLFRCENFNKAWYNITSGAKTCISPSKSEKGR